MQTFLTPEQVEKTLEEKKAEDIVVMNVRELTSVCDHIIVATGTSTQHVRALAGYVLDLAKETHTEILGTEGLDHREWVLIDLGSILVHIMLEETRLYYELEKLWFSDSN